MLKIGFVFFGNNFRVIYLFLGTVCTYVDQEHPERDRTRIFCQKSVRCKRTCQRCLSKSSSHFKDFLFDTEKFDQNHKEPIGANVDQVNQEKNLLRVEPFKKDKIVVGLGADVERDFAVRGDSCGESN